jgi:hypothetical protein
MKVRWESVPIAGIYIAPGDAYVLALTQEGEVSACSYAPDELRREIWNWENITALALASDFLSYGHMVLGLTAEGRVLKYGEEENTMDVSGWNNITAISASRGHVAGLRADGTVVAAGNNEDGACNVSEWRNIVDIATDNDHTYGLRADGTVVATGIYLNGVIDLPGWTDIDSIYTISRVHPVLYGIRSDGTVAAVMIHGTDNNYNYGGDFSDEWRDIIAVSRSTAGLTLGLRSDGTVVYHGTPNLRQVFLSDWKLK